MSDPSRELDVAHGLRTIGNVGEVLGALGMVGAIISPSHALAVGLGGAGVFLISKIIGAMGGIWSCLLRIERNTRRDP